MQESGMWDWFEVLPECPDVMLFDNLPLHLTHSEHLILRGSIPDLCKCRAYPSQKYHEG